MRILPEAVPSILQEWGERDLPGMLATAQRLAVGRASRLVPEVPDDLAQEVALAVLAHLRDPEELARLARSLPVVGREGHPVVYRDKAHVLSRIVRRLTDRLVKRLFRAESRAGELDASVSVGVDSTAFRAVEDLARDAELWTRAQRVLSPRELDTLRAYLECVGDGGAAALRLGIKPGAFRVRLSRIVRVLRASLVARPR